MAFSAAVQQKLIDLNHSAEADTNTFYDNMNAAIHYAVDTVVPEVSRSQGIKRKVSNKTKALFEKRTRMRGRNQGQYEKLQKEIKETRLNDFKEWVEEHCKSMEVANRIGDTKSIFKSTKVLAGKHKQPPKRLTTDGKGNLLTSAKEVASRWYGFLRDKFAATRQEQDRPPMRPLSNTIGQFPLSKEEILEGLAKMKAAWQGNWPRWYTY